MKAFFLDRDGVINECHSVNTPDEFVLLPGADHAVKLLNDAGFEVFVVTNQGGVGLGYMSEDDLTDVHLKMMELISSAGGTIKEVRACIHKPSQGCYCRKPKAGMMKDLIKKYGIDPLQSYMVGDRDVDILAGKNAGLKTVLISSAPLRNISPDFIFPSLYEAVTKLIETKVLS